ncbi:MAG: ribose 5-phosphate isomerase B [Candidatus Omnitrophota bacterium]
MAKRGIVLGADHGGFVLKEKIKDELKKMMWRVSDAGTFSAEACDYPKYGFEAAKEVSEKKSCRGVVICKTGVGMAIVANKLPGVRAAVCGSEKEAVSSRQHNDANVLVLAAAKMSAAKAIKIMKVWLKTSALKGRHSRRVKQIEEIEDKLFIKSRFERCNKKGFLHETPKEYRQ